MPSSTFHLRMPHRCSKWFRSGDMLGQSITFTLSFFSKAVVVILLEYCPAVQSPKGGDQALLQYVHSTCWHSWFPSMNCSSPVPAALMQPQTMTLPPPCLTVGKTLVFVLLTGCHHHTLDTMWTKYVYLGLIRPQDMFPVICLSSANCLQAFLCIIFRRGFRLWWQPCRPIWCSVRRMVWALTGWPPPPIQPLQQCWQHWYVYFPNTTSGYDAEHMHSTWSSMVRPVLSGTCPVKPLYGLGHCAAAQFQGLGNLLIAYTIFM